MISISFGVFRHEVAKNSSHTLNDVVFIEPPLAVSPIHLIIARSHPDKEAIMNAFNRGLASIKEDGSYDEILNAHGF